MLIELSICLLASVAAIPAPDSLVLPMRADTIQEVELTMFPPEGAQAPFSYRIAWGDGETLAWTEPARHEYTRYHRYRRTGDYQVRVRVRDGSGQISPWSAPVALRVADPVLKWVFPTFDPIVAAPALDDKGNVYVGDEEGWFYSVDAQGKLRWSHQTGGPVYAAAAVFRNSVYVVSLDSFLYCFDLSGKLRWKTFLEDEAYTAPAIGANGAVYVGTDAGTLLGIAPNGKVGWRYKTGDEISSSPSIGLSGLIYITSDSVYCIDTRGRRRWAFGTPEGDYFFAPVVPDLAGNVYAGNEDGSVYCVGPDGRLRWRAPVPDEDEIRTEVVIGNDDTLYVGSDGYYLFRKVRTGPFQLLYEADDAIMSTPALSAAGTLYFLADDGFVHAVSGTGRQVWKHEIAMDEKSLYYTSSPAIGPDGTVYVASWDGALYAFEGDGPPAAIPWPQYRHDAARTGRLTRIPKK